MAWLLVLIAGLFEIGWAIGLKSSHGLSRLWPSFGTAISMICSVCLLARAMRSLPVGTAYAAWTGIGAVGTVLLGVLLFGEPANPIRLLCIGLIVVGILGLKFAT